MKLTVDYLRGYPRNGKHLMVHTDLPCSITLGSDPFEFKHVTGEHKLTSTYLWYVCFDVDFVGENIPIRGFKTPDAAVRYAADSFTGLLIKGLKEMDKYSNIEIENSVCTYKQSKKFPQKTRK